MAGHGGAQADFHGFLVAHFAYQHDVRVLAQYRAQHARKGEIDFCVDLHLANARQAIFDRVLHRNNLGRGLVEFLERAIQAGGFATARGAGDQDHAVGAMDHFTEALQDILGHA